MQSHKARSFSAQDMPQDIADRIVEAVLPDVAFDGWRWDVVEQAAIKAGYDAAMASSVFPGGLPDVLDHFSDLADRWMLERLGDIDPEDLRVRDRVKTAVLLRLRALYPWRDAVRQAASFWAMPTRAGRGGRIMWRTADRIWDWAGDQAQDYNRYTKRTLLCGVLASVTLAWLDDDSHGTASTEAFLDRRIENVMMVGKTLGKVKSIIPFRKTGQYE